MSELFDDYALKKQDFLASEEDMQKVLALIPDEGMQKFDLLHRIHLCPLRVLEKENSEDSAGVAHATLESDSQDSLSVAASYMGSTLGDCTAQQTLQLV